MDTYFYNYLANTDKLFNKNIYDNKISVKPDTESFKQKLIYKKKDNPETKFILNIFSDTYIECTIPLKYNNYYYTAIFDYKDEDNIKYVYEYLQIHTLLH